jgi:parallel beta-helix repeat protein
MFISPSSASYEAAFITTSLDLGPNVYAIGFAGGAAFEFSGVNGNFSGGISRCSTVGAGIAGAGAKISLHDSNFNTTGIRLPTSGGLLVELNTVKNATTGIAGTSGTFDSEIRNNTISYCSSYGVFLTQTHGANIRENIFTGCGYDYYQDQYCGDNYLYYNQHFGPVTYAVYGAGLNTGTITVIGDTIDDGSRFKAFGINASGYNTIKPQYKLQNAFGQTGHYFAQHQITRVTGASPYTEFQFNTAVTSIRFPYKIFNTFVREGVGKELTFELNTPQTIAGLTVSPVIKLNGMEVQTEPNITSVSTGNTWDEYTVNVDALDIDEDGELSLDLGFTTGAGILRLRITGVEDV